jgi:hypothetical protein
MENKLPSPWTGHFLAEKQTGFRLKRKNNVMTLQQ